MAGHSKWANIKHRKAAQDALRGKQFTKLIRELVVAAKTGGASPEDNPRLRSAVDKALGANMKRDTIDKAIQRGAGTGEGENYEQVTYEGYGAGGVAVLVECLTDNRNRTVSDVRHAFSKRGGNLGTDGSVAYLFTRVGQISFPAGADEDRIVETAIEAGAEDVIANEDRSIDVVTALEIFSTVRDALVDTGLAFENAEVIQRAAISVAVDLEHAEAIVALVDSLEELDDVQNVYSNADIPAAVLAQLS